ncbi:putative phospholipase B-like lamina ancestor [Condylostylus longicornis]|uniref:putative phospholipase B-like lamina ancestor n=1 Tax=Condylostylus longicornis TaxID=2530218 RepID=UPI00244DE847|nr:putative phospholipase B-like lamina ancestor [Condylostylus longicornis]XP_055387143.1 putative phospholipase B-like lamina ancestor [Condylostylus longicornis]
MSTNLKVVGASWIKTRISTFILVAAGFLSICALFIAKIERPKYDGTYCATMFWNEKTGFNIEYWKQRNDLHNIPKGAARICYKDSMYQNGWSQLEIETEEKYPDWVQAFGAGMLEGTLTWSNIYHHWANTISSPCDTDESSQNFCTWLRDTVESNYVEMKKTAKLRASHDHYWHQIDLLTYQLEGMYFGWQRGAKRARSGLEEDFELTDFLLLNLAADIQDLKENFTLTLENGKKSLNKIFPNARASMLVKLFPDFEGNFKFIMGHSAAASYSSMLRMQKRYKFKFHVSPINWNTNTVPGTDISFSGYPGILASIDDFYMIKGRNVHSVVGGVSIRNENPSLWNDINNNNYHIPLSFRIMTASRLGQNRKTWEKSIGRYSITGSKQWIRVDLKKINLLQKLHSNNNYSKIDGLNDLGVHDIILLSEQVLNKYKTKDLTTSMSINWTSLWCNGIPKLKEISLFSGIPFENNNSNMKIVESNMTNLEDVDEFLRKNAFRGDLLGEQASPYGNIDMKLFTFDPVLEITDYNAISGPLFTKQKPRFFNNDISIESLTIEEPNKIYSNENSDEFNIEIISSAEPSKIPAPARLIRNDILAIAKHRYHHNRPFKWSEVDDNGVNHQGQPNEWNFSKVKPVWAWHSQ